MTGLYKFPMNTLLILKKDLLVDEIITIVNNSTISKANSKNQLKKITDFEGFCNIKFEKWKPDLVFIMPELAWKDKGVNDGYEIAYDLLTGSLNDHYFQLYFVSALAHADIKKFVDFKYLPMLSCFQHFHITKDIACLELFKYSSLHFEMIKSLALSDSGRLDVLKHNFKNLQNDFKTGSDVKERLIRLGNELSVFTVWTEHEKEDMLTEIKKADNPKNISEILKRVECFLDAVGENILPKQHEPVKNNNYKVLIIEDEPESRGIIQSAFEEVFDNVEILDPLTISDDQLKKYKRSKISDRMQCIIQDMASNYHIVVIDLLFANKNGSWTHFNGLDVYTWVKKKNPYAVIRIITSLPREVVARVAAKNMGVAISFSHVITKTTGEVSLKQQIIIRSDEIIADCKEMEKQKSVFKPYPKNGLFASQGIPDIMFRLLTQAANDFDEFYNNDVMSLLLQYTNGTLTVETYGWNRGELPSLKMKDRMEESYFLTNMKNVFVHRLIVIDYITKKGSNFVYFNDYYDILNKITNKKAVNKSYFYFLGFSGKSLNHNINGKGILLNFHGLLPGETNYIATYSNEINNIKLKEEFEDLLTWFIEVLCDMQTYEDWDNTLFGFDPYSNKDAIDDNGEIINDYLNELIISNLTITDLVCFLAAILDNYTDFEKLTDVITVSHAITAGIKLPQKIEILYNQLWEK